MPIENIFRALVEGIFIKKIIETIKVFFVTLPKRIINRIDVLIGDLSRYIWASTIPVDPNKIVFMTYSNAYICNPKYIQQQIDKENLPYDMVWVCNKGAKNISKNYPASVRVVRRGTMEAFREIASAKIWIDNSINFLWDPIPKKKNQIYIETWHGSIGLKRVGKKDVKNKRWVHASKKCNKYTDFCISNSTFEDFVYRETHWKSTPILQFGHARNDILINNDANLLAEIRNKVCEYFQIEPTDKILLYAPTFRDNGDMSVYDIDFMRLKEMLEFKYGGNWKILLRYHFHDRKKKVKNTGDFLLDATGYIDMQELLCVTDIGISDYSSWLCDFILTRRPAFIYATDLESYNTERGLYYPLETTPFPIATNNDELIQNMLEFDFDKYIENVEMFLKDKGCIDDGHASERIVNHIKKLMNTV